MALAALAVHEQPRTTEPTPTGDLLAPTLHALADDCDDPASSVRLRLLAERFAPMTEPAAA